MFLVEPAKAAPTQITFSTDTDWSSWVNKDIDYVSNGGAANSGVRIKKTNATQYELTGSMIYKITPDSSATWGTISANAALPANTSIDYSFSSSELSLDQSYADMKKRTDVKANPQDIGTSEFLFVRIDLFADSASGVGISTPSLRSLTINYTIIPTPNVYVEKHIYRYRAADPTQRVETATFVPGDMVAVKIKLSATNASNITFKVNDTMLKNPETFAGYTSKSANTTNYCGISATDNLFNNAYSYTAGSDSLEVSGINLDGVTGYLCYTYFIPSQSAPTTTWQAKNNVRQTRLNVSVNDMIVATSSNYMMVRGFSYRQSDSAAAFQNPQIIPIDDELLFSFDKFIFSGLSGQEISFAGAPSYAYKRGVAGKSRGGTLYDLPVTVTDITGGATLSSDSYYLLYGPSVYVMANLFSKNSLPDAALDFGSKNNVVSGKSDSQNKLNSQASLYNYSIDQNSVAYWNSTAGQPKSKIMQENIDRIIGTPVKRPENFCDVTANIGLLASGSLYLNNDSCQINAAASSNKWPEGRVWYFKPTGDVDLSAKIMTSGTMVFDFADAQSSNVNVTFHDGSTVGKPADFVSGAYLGIILINGGNVKFTKDCQMFNGMIFVPGAE